MFQLSSEYFAQFRKNFKYFLYEGANMPCLDRFNIKNYAYGSHAEETLYCPLDKTQKHFHVFIEVGTNSCANNLCNQLSAVLKSESYNVPCLLTSFRYLLFDASSKFLKGDIISKLNRACEYHTQKGTDSVLCEKIPKSLEKRKIPQIKSERNVATQTSFLPSVTHDRIQSVLDSQNGAQLYRILDIFLTGYGSFSFKDNNNEIHFSFNPDASNF